MFDTDEESQEGGISHMQLPQGVLKVAPLEISES